MTKVSELAGAQLDFWVAKAQGWVQIRSGYDERPLLWDTGGGFYRVEGEAGTLGDERWRPSTWWGHGGPIIERASIAICRNELRDASGRFVGWAATCRASSPEKVWATFPDGWKQYDRTRVASKDGPTMLVAAMRAFVASKFGDEVSGP